MAIEIKELVVKVVVDETSSEKDAVVDDKPQDLEKLKAEIIKKCTKEILDKLKEQQER